MSSTVWSKLLSVQVLRGHRTLQVRHHGARG